MSVWPERCICFDEPGSTECPVCSMKTNPSTKSPVKLVMTYLKGPKCPHCGSTDYFQASSAKVMVTCCGCYTRHKIKNLVEL